MPRKHVDEIAVLPVEAGTGVTYQVLIGPDQADNFAMRRFIIEPGGGMPAHTNSVEHEQYVLRGSARVGLGDGEIEVKKGDVVFIKAGEPHWYKNEGSEPFEFICVVPNKPDKPHILDK
jgi:quercetin dioxygenase-like cupin family protein